MRATRLGISLCFAFYSFVLFFVTTGVHEIAHDQLDGKPLPAIANISALFDPIGILLFIFPFLVGFASWRCLAPVKPSFELILTHTILVGLSVVAFVSILLATAFLTYMNGIHPVTGYRIFGSIIIGSGLMTVIVRSYLCPKRTDHESR